MFKNPRDEFFRIICPKCGLVPIGVRGYARQMRNPNARWWCPSCNQAPVDFDDKNYERQFEKNDEI